MKYGQGWQPAPVGWESTRGRILLAASALFAQRGYFGTSTCDTADEVQIRRPSLFHHLGAKHEIFPTLVELDLGPSIDDKGSMMAASDPRSDGAAVVAHYPRFAKP